MNKVVKVVVISLVLDILAFTTILPLLPKTLQLLRQNNDVVLDRTLEVMGTIRGYQYKIKSLFGNANVVGEYEMMKNNDGANIVLLGGLLGSLYSILQCVVAPLYGRLVDRFGRRRVLLVSMLGNIAGSLVWMYSHKFSLFLLARVISGISEANMQISTCIIADVSEPGKRTKEMALVGMAFSLGFTIGPAMGAFLGRVKTTKPYAPFGVAAMFSTIFLVIETVYMYFCLPETKKEMVDCTQVNKIKKTDSVQKSEEKVKEKKNISADKTSGTNKRLQRIYFVYMFVFSGMEYTLTFLMHNIFSYTNEQQGKLLGTIGLITATIQGSYVRRTKFTNKALCIQGMLGCIIGMVGVASTVALKTKDVNGEYHPHKLSLYTAIIGFSVASGIVTSCMNSIVSGLAGSQDLGEKLGSFRAAGQLGRAFGPGFASFLYWLFGPIVCYMFGAATVGVVLLRFTQVHY